MPGKITVQAACLGVEARKKEEGLWWGWWVTVNKGSQSGQLQRVRVTYRVYRP